MIINPFLLQGLSGNLLKIQNLKAIDMDIVQFVEANYEWLFSGVGVTVLLIIFGFMKSKGSKNKVVQTNIQAGGDVVGRDKR